MAFAYTYIFGVSRVAACAPVFLGVKFTKPAVSKLVQKAIKTDISPGSKSRFQPKAQKGPISRHYLSTYGTEQKNTAARRVVLFCTQLRQKCVIFVKNDDFGHF